MLFSAPIQASLVGSVISYEGIFQSTPTSEVQRIGALTTAVVSASEVEFPMLGELDLNVPGLRLINASLDVGADYVEFDYDNAGSGTFAVGYQNTVILRFDREAALIFTEAEIDTGVTNLPILPEDVTFDGNELFINFGSGGSYSPSSFGRINLTVVPLPAAVWMFLGALGVLGATRHFKGLAKHVCTR